MDENNEVKDEGLDVEDYEAESTDGGCGILEYLIAFLFGTVIGGFGKKIWGWLKGLFHKKYTKVDKNKETVEDDDD